MRLYDLFQYALIAVLVPVSALYVLRAQAPAFTRRVQVRLAVGLLKSGRPAWQRRFGRWIAPPPSVRLPSACSAARGCKTSSACSGCDPS